MWILDQNKYKSIDCSLKVYNQKHIMIGIVKKLRYKQTFTRISVKRITELLKTKYKHKYFN